MFDLAIYYRMVGGFIGTGSTFQARLRWAITIGLYMGFATLVHRQPIQQVCCVTLLCGLGGFLGRLIPHAMFQWPASILNSLGMALVGLVRAALVVVPYAVGWWPSMLSGEWMGMITIRFYLIAFGALAGIAYYVGIKYLNGKDSGIYFRAKHSQWRTNSLPSDGHQISINLPNTLPEDNVLDEAAIGGSEWGELLTGWWCWQLMYVAALVMP